MGHCKKSFIFLGLLVIIGLIGYEIGIRQNRISPVPKQTDVSTSTEEKFPPLKMPLEYFDAKKLSIGSGIVNNIAYNVAIDAEGYRSYPTTTISLSPDMYSTTPSDLPPIQSDEEIHGKDPELDVMGSFKTKTVQKYGDLGRRFVGSAGDGTDIYSVNFADVDKDGKNETIVSISTTGANVIGQWDVIIKGGKIIFSTGSDTFSTLIPAKNGNGFFMKWDDNFKKRDGYTTTRFIYDGEKFVPIYEQQTRYIRVYE
jgi:hypothetical protein